MKMVRTFYEKTISFLRKNWWDVRYLLLLVIAFLFFRFDKFVKWLIQDTGSVADWVGNVSIPIILAWFTFEYRSQENKNRIQNEKNKVFGLILDSNRINKNLEIACAFQNVSEFKDRLNMYIDDLKRMCDMLLYFTDHSTSEPLYSELRELIANSKSIRNFDQVEKWMNTLQAVNDALKKYYKQIK